MNYMKTYEDYEQLPVSSERTFPAAPYPRTYIHSVLDDLYDAVQAVHALRSMDVNPGDIHVMASWDYVEAVEQRKRKRHSARPSRTGASAGRSRSPSGTCCVRRSSTF